MGGKGAGSRQAGIILLATWLEGFGKGPTAGVYFEILEVGYCI